MIIFKKKEDLQKYLSTDEQKQQKIGFVPTMGALHAGHLSLIERARRETDVVLCSIFVNPTQFNQAEDLEKYPVQVEKDIEYLIEAGADILFLPGVEEIYPQGMKNLETYAFGYLEEIGEGKHRPGHFQGVGQVLARLLKIVDPDKMYMGQKDYQQILITRKLIELLHSRTEIVAVPIKREKDGLAMSSRNARLSQKGRKKAPAIYRSLKKIEAERATHSFPECAEEVISSLEKEGIEVEYLLLADAGTLLPETDFEAHPQVVLIAAWLDGVRLIDNVLL